MSFIFVLEVCYGQILKRKQALDAFLMAILPAKVSPTHKDLPICIK